MTGLIVLWSGAIVDIPNGWALCDGTNGTPDLRNRFIVGAGDTYAVDASGGNLTHTHTGNTNVSNDFLGCYTSEDNDQLDSGEDIDYAYDDPYFSEYTIGHYHEVNDYTDGHSHNLLPNVANHLPPYYALAYIMKL